MKKDIHQNGWNEYSKLVISELERLNDGITKLNVEIQDLKGEIKELKVKEDFELIGLNIEDKYIEALPEDEYKKLIKNKVRQAAFCELEALKNSYSKVSQNQYEGLNKP